MFVMTTIAINAGIMACEHHDQSEYLTHLFELANTIFTFVFLFELVIKMIAFGFTTFIKDGFNMLDTVIITIKYLISNYLKIKNFI